MSNRWQDQFLQDARLLPHLIDMPTDQVLLSQLNEEDYRKASFLDQRIVTPQLKRQLVPWSELSKVTLPEKPPPQYIFHIGHVGSTLISRLFGEVESVLALREPQLLRDLCEISQIQGRPQSPWSPDQYDRRLTETKRWLSRSFRHGQRVMIKASSFVSELATQLLDDQNDALFLYVPLKSYLPTILAGETSVQETHAMAAPRLLRLAKHLGETPANLWELNLAKRAALSWVCEMVSLYKADRGSVSASILWMDFETFLADPADQLMIAAKHFNHNLSRARARALIAGPIMSSYSKAPEHDYSPDLRRQLLEQANQNHADGIRAAMLWVDQLASRYPLIADAIRNVEERP